METQVRVFNTSFTVAESYPVRERMSTIPATTLTVTKRSRSQGQGESPLAGESKELAGKRRIIAVNDDDDTIVEIGEKEDAEDLAFWKKALADSEVQMEIQRRKATNIRMNLKSQSLSENLDDVSKHLPYNPKIVV
jgi:hypothetical protein